MQPAILAKASSQPTYCFPEKHTIPSTQSHLLTLQQAPQQRQQIEAAAQSYKGARGACVAFQPSFSLSLLPLQPSKDLAGPESHRWEGMGASVAGQPFFSPFQSLPFLLQHFLPHSRLHQQRCLYRQTHLCAICCQNFSAKSMPKCCVPCLLQ